MPLPSGSIGLEGLSPPVKDYTPGVDETTAVDLQPAGLCIVGPERPTVEASLSIECLHMTAVVVALQHVEEPAGPPAQAVQGVVGILASRIKEKYHRPVIAFAMVEGGKELKGSARSIGGFHIRDALDAVATKNPGLITKFGGHAMAAGLGLAPDKLTAFRSAFEAEARQRLSRSQLQAVIESDGEVAANYLTLETAQLIQAAGPWGQAFPEPQFDGRFLLRDQRRLGGKHLKMVLSPESEPGKMVDAIAFNVPEETWPDSQATQIELVFRLAVNDFRDSLNLQLMVEKMRIF